MSGSASQGLEQQLLQHTLAIAPMAPPARVYVALCRTLPSEATGGTEVVGGGYARVAATFSMLSATIAANAATVEFPAAAVDWGDIGYFEIWSAATGGDRLYWGALVDPADPVNPMVMTIAAGNVVRFSAGALSVQVAETPTLATGPYLPLVGGTVTGTVTSTAAQAPLVISRNASISTANNRAIASFNNYSGTYTGANTALAAHALNVSGDNVNTGAAGGSYNLYAGHSFGGSNVSGNRTGFWSQLTQTAASGNHVFNRYYTAIGGDATSSINDNGAPGAPVGNLFGFNILARLLTGATYWNSVIGGEIDIVAAPGTSMNFKEGLKIVLYANDAVQGAVADSGIVLGASVSATASLGFRIGLNLCSETGQWPIDITNGTLIGAGVPVASSTIPKNAKLGVDFSSVTFSEAAFKSAGFKVDGAGIVTAATVQTGTTSGPTWTTGTAAPTSTQPVGSLYSRGGGAVGATLYVSRGGGTWAAVAGV